MASKKQLFIWCVDAGLLAGFLLAFFLNITGLDLHQWLGIFLGGFALYHLFLHWGWVKKITTRFLHQTSWRMRAYYILDAGVLWGFITITVTGVVISTWLNIWLSNYNTWRDVHVWVSIITLLAVVVKISLHWRWIVNVLAKAIKPPTVPVLLVPANGRLVSRRQFLVLMGVVGAGAFLGISNVLDKKQAVLANVINDGPQSSPAPTATRVTASATPVAAATAAAPCRRCPRGQHCSFPGRCGRYTDQNNNGRCDLGECA
jgi:hypothetical protein